MAAGSREEVIACVGALVTKRFAGDYEAAFAFYDMDKTDLGISWDELTRLFTDAGVGSRWTRRLYVAGAFKELDQDEDGVITLGEFRQSFSGGSK